MASLQDQLLKAGLTNKNKANKANKEKQKQQNKARHSGTKMQNVDEETARKKQQQRALQDRELNLQKQNASKQKEIAAQIRQLIDINKLDRAKGEIEYSFVFQNKVKNMLLDEQQKKQLTLGRLAIVTWLHKKQDKFEIVAAAVAQKIAQRDQQSVVQLNELSSAEDAGDDPYADYQIPDDLIW